MIIKKKDESTKTRSSDATNQSKNIQTKVINFTDIQKTRKLEAAKRHVYAIADNLNW